GGSLPRNLGLRCKDRRRGRGWASLGTWSVGSLEEISGPRVQDSRSKISGSGLRRRPLPSSGAFGPRALTAAPDRPQLDAAEGLGGQVRRRDLVHLRGCDRSNPVGPGHRLVQGMAPALQVQEPLGALLDALIIEDPGTGEVAAGAFELIVGERAGAHRADLVG